MADTKITDLTTGNPAESGDEIPINRGGLDRKITAGSIAALATAGLIFTVSASAPVSPDEGDQWLDTTSGILYTFFDDGDTEQWVEFTGGRTATLSLDEVSDVDVPTPDGGDVLSWNADDARWVAVPGQDIADLAFSGSVTLSELAPEDGILPLANGGTASALSDPGADSLMMWDDGGGEVVFTPITNIQTASVGITIDGGAEAITTGVKGYIEVPYAGTITAWTLLGDVSGAIKIDVWKDVYANFPPDDSVSITNAHEPEITASGVKAQDTSLGDWTSTAITAGDIIGFNVDSCTSIKRAHLILKISKT
jgi:hypothetical protein